MSQENRKIKVSRLYADESGESHFIDEQLEVIAQDFAPPAPAFFVSEPTEAKRTVYLLLPEGYYGEPHPAPRRQIMTLISGSLESSVSDGETRQFTPGNTMLVEDTTGKGHATRALTDCVMVVTQLD